MSDPNVVVRLLAAIDETANHGPSADLVLRLCQSHRDIVAMYQEAAGRPVAQSAGKHRGLDHASAMGRLTTLGLVLQVLARGYGIEDGEG